MYHPRVGRHIYRLNKLNGVLPLTHVFLSYNAWQTVQDPRERGPDWYLLCSALERLSDSV